MPIVTTLTRVVSAPLPPGQSLLLFEYTFRKYLYFRLLSFRVLIHWDARPIHRTWVGIGPAWRLAVSFLPGRTGTRGREGRFRRRVRRPGRCRTAPPTAGFLHLPASCSSVLYALPLSLLLCAGRSSLCVPPALTAARAAMPITNLSLLCFFDRAAAERAALCAPRVLYMLQYFVFFLCTYAVLNAWAFWGLIVWWGRNGKVRVGLPSLGCATRQALLAPASHESSRAAPRPAIFCMAATPPPHVLMRRRTGTCMPLSGPCMHMYPCRQRRIAGQTVQPTEQ